MESNIKKEEDDKLNDIFNYKTNFSLSKNAISKKNIFLSLQCDKGCQSRNNKSHLNMITINFPSRNKQNKSKDSLYASKTIKTDNNERIIRKYKILRIGKKFENNPQKNNNIIDLKGFTFLVEKSSSNFDGNYKRNNLTNFNTLYRERRNNSNNKLNIAKQKDDTSKKINLKTQEINFHKKSYSKYYLAPLYQDKKKDKLEEEASMKRINVGYMMKKNFRKNITQCLLKDDNKYKGELDPHFKLGNKYFPGDKLKDLKERNEFYSKLEKIYDEDRERKLRKKFTSLRNCHEVLDYYRKHRILNCRKLIERTLFDAKKAKKEVCKFFEQYKKVFDAYDDWNDPKNEDNLYN